MKLLCVFLFFAVLAFLTLIQHLFTLCALFCYILIVRFKFVLVFFVTAFVIPIYHLNGGLNWKIPEKCFS